MARQSVFRIVVIALISTVSIFLVTFYVVKEQKQKITEVITTQILDQERILTNLAKATDLNQFDNLNKTLIRDCSQVNRQRFESLLNNLAGLTPAELSEIEQLFDGCARFYANQKALMVARLTREKEIFSDYVGLLQNINKNNVAINFRVTDWDKLILLEQQRADLYLRQAEVQLVIIQDLSQGATLDADDIRKSVADAELITEEAKKLQNEINQVWLLLNKS